MSARIDAIISDLCGLQTQISSEPTSDCPVTPASERFHSSFLDSIVNPQWYTDDHLHNTDQFCIDLSKSHTYITRACLQCMDDFLNSEQGATTLYTELSGGLRYAFDYWASHVYGSDVISNDLWHAVTDFCECNFDHCFQIQIQSLHGASVPDSIPNLDPDLDAPGQLDQFRVECQWHLDVHQLDMIISVQGVVMRLAADGHPHKDKFLTGMGDSLRDCFCQVGRMSDLETSLKFYHQALVLCPPDHPCQCGLMQKLSSALLVQYCQTALLSDLNEVITLQKQALALDLASGSQFQLLCNLAIVVYAQYERDGNPQDLRDVNSMTKEAGPLCNASGINHAFLVLRKYLSCANTEIHEWHHLINFFQEQVKSYPATHPHQPSALNNLAYIFYTQFSSTGKLDDLNEATDLG
jgi:hypothetical protein